jgi:hypothetical protein
MAAYIYHSMVIKSLSGLKKRRVEGVRFSCVGKKCSLRASLGPTIIQSFSGSNKYFLRAYISVIPFKNYLRASWNIVVVVGVH